MKPSVLARALALGVVCAAAAATAFAGFAATDTFLPMVGRQAGIFPSNWYTTVWIYNPGSAVATARIYLLVRNTANPTPPYVDVPVGAGATEKLDNVVESLFHQQVFGALRVTCGSEKLVVTSRVYSKGAGSAEKDSVGQDFAGVPASFAIGLHETSRILGTYQTEPSADSDYRFNFGLVETTGHSATVTITAFDAHDVSLGSVPLQVREYSQRQVAFKDYFPAVSTDNVRLEVEVTAGSGKVIAYGSGITNGSQDPTTFEMQYQDKLLGAANVQHDATLTGDGTAGAPLGLANGAVTDAKVASGIAYAKISGAPSSLPPSGTAGGSLTGTYPNPGIAGNAVGNAQLADAAVTAAKVSSAGGFAGAVLTASGPGAAWQQATLALPYNATTSYEGNAFVIHVTTDGTAVAGSSFLGDGVYGFSTNTNGVHGVSAAGPGVAGTSTDAIGIVGTGFTNGVYGETTTPGGVGVHGISSYGAAVLGESTNGNGVRGSTTSAGGVAGVLGDAFAINGNGVIGQADIGTGAYGVWGKSSSGYAGYFSGDGYFSGLLTKAGGGFKIDHPLAPSTKYLQHSFVESPDMKNVYDGVVVLDSIGEAVVDLPDWFEALNRDFRYQLTCIGGAAVVYIADEIAGNRFRIAGGRPGLKVSWQVTGIRHDAWAEAHRLVVEEDKPAVEQGTYLHPDLFGQPEEKSVEWAHHPAAMKAMSESRAKAGAEKR
jgi:hypothetical protein